MNLKYLGRRVGGCKQTTGVVDGCSAASYSICMPGDVPADRVWNDGHLANNNAGDMGVVMCRPGLARKPRLWPGFERLRLDYIQA